MRDAEDEAALTRYGLDARLLHTQDGGMHKKGWCEGWKMRSEVLGWRGSVRGDFQQPGDEQEDNRDEFEMEERCGLQSLELQGLPESC